MTGTRPTAVAPRWQREAGGRGFAAVLPLTLAGLLATLSACASSPALGPDVPGRQASGEKVWTSLLAGDLAAADALLTGAGQGGAQHRASPAALFAEALLAHGRGQDERATSAVMSLLEAAARPRRDPLTARMAAAASGLLSELFQGLSAPGRFEDRLLSLPTDRLPWPARVAIDGLIDGVARRRGDAVLLRGRPARVGCLTEVAMVGAVGRLPHLDLAVPLPPGAGPSRRLEPSGCRLQVESREGVATVRVLTAKLPPLPAGAQLVLDYGGPALIRIDGGAWRSHTSAHRYGPRWSAFPVASGSRSSSPSLEVRLGTWGGPAELRLYLLGGADLPPAKATSPVQQSLALITDALIGELTGDVDMAQAAASSLARLRRVTVALQVAARVVATDPSRPQSMVRDQAQGLYRQALTGDPTLARVMNELGRMELARDRTSEAMELGEQAYKVRPAFWPATVTLLEALRGRGFEKQADQLLDEALARLEGGQGACPLLQLALDRAHLRHKVAEEEALARRLQACDAQSGALVEWHRRRGDVAAVAAALERQLPVVRDRLSHSADLAALRVAQGDPAAAARELSQLIRRQPRDPLLRVRLADALALSGQTEPARELLGRTAGYFPGQSSLRQIARIQGRPLPLDDFRLDGRAVIREYQQQGREYKAPAVLVLDRTVARVLPDGTQIILTHNIVNVRSKDGIARWGEVQVPDGAEILALRTHKPDGSIREAEEIAGKESISAPELAALDFVEWETIEYRDPSDGFAPGFLGDRFYFQSVELPLDRSELLLVSPRELAVAADIRAGGPRGEVAAGKEPGTVVHRYVMKQMPQLFQERAAPNHVEWIPSVRLSSGMSIGRWMRLIEEQLFGVARTSPALRLVAARIREEARRTGLSIPHAVVSWVNRHVEHEAIPLEPATVTLARGRGNRAALMVALARTLGVPASLALVRPLGVAAGSAAVVPEELDDFQETLVRFPPTSAGQPAQYVDPRLQHAPFGYLPAVLDGAPSLVLASGNTEVEWARSASADARGVSLSLKLDAEGAAVGTVIEELRGSPAIDWAAAVERTGEDERKLRQDFEQRWLGHHFPGSRLGGLAVDSDARTPGRVRLRYSFTHPGLAVRTGDELKLSPTFFRSQPGRRFATENRRRATLVVGVDPPLDLVARVELPPGARVVDAGGEGAVSVKAGQGRESGTISLVERRQLQGRTLTITRSSRVPIVRVSPEAYADVAPELRRMDRLEQAEIRLALPAANKESGAAK